MLKKKMFQLCVELTNGNMSSKALKKLTKSNLSRLMIQPFAKVYDINTDEILDEIDDFKNLNEFFIRKLHPVARPINQDEDALVSPTDGVISVMREHLLLRIKFIMFKPWLEIVNLLINIKMGRIW